MKTVITDRSLCALPLSDDARPEHIFGYIKALADAGVRYIELDFHTIMRLNELPDGVGYIFRLCDPMFAELADVFDFDYVLLTLDDLRAKLPQNVRTILELPAQTHLSQKMCGIIESQIGRRIDMLRLRGDYGIMTLADAAKYILKLKNNVTVPVELCPTNGKKTALDCAIKFSLASADCLTLCTGTSKMYAGLEEYAFTLMSVYGMAPPNLNLAAIIRASVFGRLIFRSGKDGISQVMHLLDRDIEGLYNADTGERVNMRVSFRESGLLHQHFMSALEKMAQDENLPDEIFEEIAGAIAHFGFSLFSADLPSGSKSLLN